MPCTRNMKTRIVTEFPFLKLRARKKNAVSPATCCAGYLEQRNCFVPGSRVPGSPLRRQRVDNCVKQLLSGDQLRLGARSTLRRWSPGLETTSELTAITWPPSALRRWCQGLTTIGPKFWTLPRLRQSFENNPRAPSLTSHRTVTS